MRPFASCEDSQATPSAWSCWPRLAVDEREHGSGHGGFLLAEALVRAVTAGEAVAARLVVVDAIDDEAAAFYEHFGFTRAPEHPRRRYRRTKDIRASLDR